MVLAHPALIFAEGEVQRPVQRVFNPPVAANGAGELLGVGRLPRRQATDLVPPFDRLRGGGRGAAAGFDHPDPGQSRPRVGAMTLL